MGFKIWSRDVKQAFVQSDLDLARELYVCLPKEPPLLSMMGMPHRGLLQAINLSTVSQSPLGIGGKTSGTTISQTWTWSSLLWTHASFLKNKRTS